MMCILVKRMLNKKRHQKRAHEDRAGLGLKVLTFIKDLCDTTTLGDAGHSSKFGEPRTQFFRGILCRSAPAGAFLSNPSNTGFVL